MAVPKQNKQAVNIDHMAQMHLAAADIIQPKTWEEIRFQINTPTTKVLNCIWNSQRDNVHTPGSACNVTAMQSAMSMDFPQTTDDQLWELCYSPQVWNRLSRIFDKGSMNWLASMRDKKALNEVHSVLLAMLQEFVGEPFVRRIENLDHAIVKREIDNGYAVVAAGLFTHAGHFICIIGYDETTGNYIVNDSWGDWTKRFPNGRPYASQNGDHVQYPIAEMYKMIPFGGKPVRFLSRVAFLIHSDRRIPV